MKPVQERIDGIGRQLKSVTKEISKEIDAENKKLSEIKKRMNEIDTKQDKIAKSLEMHRQFVKRLEESRRNVERAKQQGQIAAIRNDIHITINSLSAILEDPASRAASIASVSEDRKECVRLLEEANAMIGTLTDEVHRHGIATYYEKW